MGLKKATFSKNNLSPKSLEFSPISQDFGLGLKKHPKITNPIYIYIFYFFIIFLYQYIQKRPFFKPQPQKPYKTAQKRNIWGSSSLCRQISKTSKKLQCSPKTHFSTLFLGLKFFSSSYRFLSPNLSPPKNRPKMCIIMIHCILYYTKSPSTSTKRSNTKSSIILTTCTIIHKYYILHIILNNHNQNTTEH